MKGWGFRLFRTRENAVASLDPDLFRMGMRLSDLLQRKGPVPTPRTCYNHPQQLSHSLCNAILVYFDTERR
uniref:Uncharacterized protein n=1 Tax=Candidatus Kentrum sp. DK TaxID=2126562 RepID=A0A450S6P4_9GAMM|nr:MAG: hypothetical protein BECKDK2373C_GA0170839_101332 [Candidatus Kentron sp. DK]VFJ47555.1 MAG: hypothetical protein BECKDK2373B_GA0170837_101725 [Candidatus Kentron sp. DK]